MNEHKYLDYAGLVNLWQKIKEQDDSIKSQINNLNYESNSVIGGDYISEINQTQGQILVIKANIPVKDIKINFGDQPVSVVSENVATITYDSEVKQGSQNAVQSNAVYEAIAGVNKSTLLSTEITEDNIKKTNPDGTIHVKDHAVKVKGLKSAAFSDISDLNAIAQGYVDAAKGIIDSYTVNDQPISKNVTITATDIPMGSESGTSISSEISNLKTKTDAFKIVQKGEDLPTGVKARYMLVANGDQNTALGVPIDIYKDSALANAELVEDNGKQPEEYGYKKGEHLHLEYHTATGKSQHVYIDVSQLLSEQEAGNGLQRNGDGTISVMVDPGSEVNSNDPSLAFLSVTKTGLKLSGIKNEISKKLAEKSEQDKLNIQNAINALDSSTEDSEVTKGETSLVDGEALTMMSVENGRINSVGKIKVVQHSALTTEDIASAIEQASAPEV